MNINKEQLKKDLNHIVDVSTDMEQLATNLNQHVKLLVAISLKMKDIEEVEPVNITGYSKTNLKIIK